MPNCIARIFEPLFRLLNPRSGRHRAANEHATVRRQEVRTWAQPYVLTPGERQEQRLQPAQQTKQRLARYGADAGPRWVHRVEAAG